MEAARAAPARELELAAGEMVEAEIPAGALYEFRVKGTYQVTASCPPLQIFLNILRICI